MSGLDLARPGAATLADCRTWARRLWQTPIWVHAVALGAILVALLAVVGWSSSFSADEGAAIVQARSLAHGDGWIVEHPFPQADPTAANYPLELAERGPRGFAPFGKHPLYALLLAGVDRVVGLSGMVLLSLAGTVAAAGLAAALARRIDPGLARPTLWTVGLASPLLFDGYLVIAHTLGAALAAAAVLVAVVAIERRRPIGALALMPLVAGAVLLRREAILFALALAVTAGVLAVRRATYLQAAGAVAVCAFAAGVAAQLAERAWTRRLLGGTFAWTGAGAPDSGSSGLVAGRWRGFLLTWLTPGYGLQSPAPLALLVMFVAIVAGAFLLRRQPDRQGALTRWSVVAAASGVVALFTGPTTVVPGFLVAFPVAAAGFLLLRRETMRTVTAQMGLGVFVLFALAVIATQYGTGGSGEWGGRYFAIGIPVLVPVLMLALHDAGSRLSARLRRQTVVSLAACSLVLAAIGMGALRYHHESSAQIVSAFDRAAQAAGGERPVLVSTQGSAPRFAWSTFDRQRWLLADPSGLPDLFDRLRTAGVGRVAFVTRDLSRDGPLVPGSATVLSRDDSAGDRGWHVFVLQLD